MHTHTCLPTLIHLEMHTLYFENVWSQLPTSPLLEISFSCSPAFMLFQLSRPLASSTCVWACVCVCMCVCVLLCVCSLMCVCVRVHAWVFIFVHMCVSVYVSSSLKSVSTVAIFNDPEVESNMYAMSLLWSSLSLLLSVSLTPRAKSQKIPVPFVTCPSMYLLVICSVYSD